MQSSDRLNNLFDQFNLTQYKALHEEMGFEDYLEKVCANPFLSRSAYQRLYDMVAEKGIHTYERFRRKVNHWKFFDDQIFGLDPYLDSFVKALKSAARWHGTERRILMLHGPVGSSKSTICSLIKMGLEKYTLNDQGAIYTYEWINVPTGQGGVDNRSTIPCPMHDDPLRLLPLDVRRGLEKELSVTLRNLVAGRKKADKNDLSEAWDIRLGGNLNPQCQYYWNALTERNGGDWSKVLREHIKVHRFAFSEANRIGIGTFQPKDEKNQDSTELTGDINYRQLSVYGVDSDPRAFSFDGEFQVSHRGALEFIEVLKLAKEFLYDLLGAAQERQVKPKKFPQISIDVALIAHTNDPEYQKLIGDQTMEALRDRMIRIDIPYTTRISDELKILQKDYSNDKVGVHIAPHTLETAALFDVLTRLQVPDKDHRLTLVDKAKLYDGQSIVGFTEDNVKEMIDKYEGEGMKQGLSPRFSQNVFAQELVNPNRPYINPFIILNVLQENISWAPSITNEQHREHYRNCITHAKKELEEVLKREVQQALVLDDSAHERLCTNYIDNVFAHINESKVTDPYTGLETEPNERLMRSVEEKANVPEQQADDFRRQVAAWVGYAGQRQVTFSWDSNPRLKKAFEAKLFDEVKDTVKLSKLSIGAAAVDPDLQEKIDTIKQRLIDHYGYNSESATDVLNYVGSIFARGDIVDQD